MGSCILAVLLVVRGAVLWSLLPSSKLQLSRLAVDDDVARLGQDRRSKRAADVDVDVARLGQERRSKRAVDGDVARLVQDRRSKRAVVVDDDVARLGQERRSKRAVDDDVARLVQERRSKRAVDDDVAGNTDEIGEIVGVGVIDFEVHSPDAVGGEYGVAVAVLDGESSWATCFAD